MVKSHMMGEALKVTLDLVLWFEGGGAVTVL